MYVIVHGIVGYSRYANLDFPKLLRQWWANFFLRGRIRDTREARGPHPNSRHNVNGVMREEKSDFPSLVEGEESEGLSSPFLVGLM